MFTGGRWWTAMTVLVVLLGGWWSALFPVSQNLHRPLAPRNVREPSEERIVPCTRLGNNE